LTRLLFVTSNGTGLGHLTRGMAIARRLSPGVEPAFLTLSAAAPVVEQMGFHVEYFPSHTAAAAESPRRWDRRLRARLELLLGELEPDLLVFDGAHPYDALIAVLRAHRGGRMRTVWCRRPMWREGTGAEAIYWASEFDAVLEPGELAEAEDRGLTVARREDAERVGPIVFLDRGELLSREEATAELGLDPERPHALVALGQGPELDRTVARCLELLAAHPEVQVAALESSLSPELRVPGEVVHLRGTYPMSRFYRAFDLAVAAAGYNAFHELCAHGVPSLFVPMPRQIDDQAARAGWAQESGVGRGLAGPEDPALERKLGELVDADVRSSIREALGALPDAEGARDAAAWLTGLVGGEDGSGSQPGEDLRPHRVAKPRHAALSVSAELVKRVGPRLPLIALRRARQRVTDPPPPPARLAAIALGLPADELISRLRGLARDEGVEPHRLLAITDSLEFIELRRAGFAFEYVPSPERAAAITDEPYPRFAERRIRAILAGRRRMPWTTISAP
jgi:UDP:flavonoid glycosyltransferase YjiC (YdhE family)